VRQDGHDVPEAVTGRRFGSELAAFFILFEPVADSWPMFDNSGIETLRLIAAKKRNAGPVVRDPAGWQRLREAGR